MPRLKKEIITRSLGHNLGTVSIDVIYHVSASGEFYCEIPLPVLSFFEKHGSYANEVYCATNRADKLSIYGTQLKFLEDILSEALLAVNKPEITEEHIIRYNIESHVSFAETPDGEVFPNSGYPNAKWLDQSGKDKMYGQHYASRQASGGYSLCVGAKALTKTTIKVGDRVTVEFSPYDKSKASRELNSWTSFSLPDKAKEIPYNDQAALFFHNLMLGMAKLSKQIQEATFEQDNLVALIESNGMGLLGSSAVIDHKD